MNPPTTPVAVEERHCRLMAELDACSLRGNRLLVLANFEARAVANLRAELAALVEDKARLDLLDRTAQLRERTLAIMERGADHEPTRWAGVEWDGLETTVRVAIDFHRNR